MKVTWSDRLGRGFRGLINQDPVRAVVLGYGSYMLLGWGLLALPWSQAEGHAVSALDHLFVAVSAVSTTGLVTVSPGGDYSGFGQLIMLGLIQFGGLGYMTLSSFLLLSIGGGITPWRKQIGATSLSLPAGFDVSAFLRLTVIYTLLIEAVGAVLLHGLMVRHGIEGAWWQAVFHSVSAFCTAGFSLFDDGLVPFRDDVPFNLVIIALSYLGAMGFIIVSDLWSSIRHRSARATLTTKIILVSTALVSLIGTVLIAWDEPVVTTLPLGERWLAAWFQVMSASTTVGFNTVSIGELSSANLFLLTVVMIIGASPAGTGGGLKTTTFSALWAVGAAVMRGHREVTFLGRIIPMVRVRMAIASTFFYAMTLAAGIYALSLAEAQMYLADLVFEAISALGTVGLSRGITADLTVAGKLIVTGLMFVGRAGPLALGSALFRGGADRVAPEEDVIV